MYTGRFTTIAGDCVPETRRSVVRKETKVERERQKKTRDGEENRGKARARRTCDESVALRRDAER